MKDGKKDEAEEVKAKVAAGNARIDELTDEEKTNRRRNQEENDGYSKYY